MYESQFSHIISVYGDQDQYTIIESILAASNSIPPLVIMKGVIILKRWFTELPPELNNLLVSTSDSGYSNNTLFF